MLEELEKDAKEKAASIAFENTRVAREGSLICYHMKDVRKEDKPNIIKDCIKLHNLRSRNG